MLTAGDANSPPSAWVELPDKNTVPLGVDCHIGRTEGNEIVNPDSRISRRHAVIQRQGLRYVLVDLGSTNGTFVNETRVFTSRKLVHGDVILVGSQRYVFHQPALAAASVVNESAQRTIVAVGKTPCWMVLVAPPAPPDAAATAWRERIRQLLVDGGAAARNGPGHAFLAHWRSEVVTPAKIGLILLEIVRLPRPAGASVTVHYGEVRVSTTAASAGENLLGAEVAAVHKLAASPAAAEAGLLLSDAAAQALGPAPHVLPIASRPRPPGAAPLFTVRAPGDGTSEG